MQKLFSRRVLQIGHDYSFSGVTLKGHSWEQFPAIHRLMSYANETLGLSFNSCLGAHKDIEPCLDNIGVLSVSLGDACPFIFRRGKAVHSGRRRRVLLECAGEYALYARNPKAIFQQACEPNLQKVSLMLVFTP